MTKIANISHASMHLYTGTAMPTDYKFVCWVEDECESELLEDEWKNGREIIQVIFPDDCDSATPSHARDESDLPEEYGY